MKIVLDSNILLIAVGRKSKYKPIWTAFVKGEYVLILSDEVIYEYEEILQLRAINNASAIVMQALIESPFAIYQQVYYSWNVITKDPDDNKFFDIAVASNADYLVTNDAHFNIVKQLSFPKVKIITADEFLHLLEILP